jgi:hypothetical protein
MNAGDLVKRIRSRGTLGWSIFCNHRKLPVSTDKMFKITRVERDHIYIDGHVQKFGKENFMVVDASQCEHPKFIPYIGLTEVYHYCEVCDKKQY